MERSRQLLGGDLAFIAPDVARSPEDFDKCRELQNRLDPAGIIPPFGQPGNLTYVIRDNDDRSTIMGMIHTELVLEVRSMLVEKFNHAQVSYTLLHRGMEMNMRANNRGHYYITVPRTDTRVISMFEKDGAQIVDRDAVRFLKTL